MLSSPVFDRTDGIARSLRLRLFLYLHGLCCGTRGRIRKELCQSIAADKDIAVLILLILQALNNFIEDVHEFRSSFVPA